ncbi:MAG: hypothetical protein AAFR11_15180 [Pseudomonadota bacterium]
MFDRLSGGRLERITFSVASIVFSIDVGKESYELSTAGIVTVRKKKSAHGEIKISKEDLGWENTDILLQLLEKHIVETVLYDKKRSAEIIMSDGVTSIYFQEPENYPDNLLILENKSTGKWSVSL